ncbi:MAG: type II secretion system F family protein [Candidatus Sungiibacteriota bacterium]|uniref:Type II secretion system F family protein n=1 Tax=Candidatus Sungiibacteriota bacterium TaxID=2750080 RepID=A0A7T5UQC3_9BACT|nr:MAG: type II secretion system F family protein [Candidatus Sungbacteria bacterium]
MATFEYQARTREGELRSGMIESSSQEAALDLLQQNNLLIISIKEKAKPTLLELRVPFVGRIKQKDVVVLSRQLATLFEARIPMIQALKTLIGETTKPALKEAVAEILDDVSGGLALSQAMTKHPHVFSSFYVNLVRSGEESGKLQEVFTYLADYLERSYYLTSKAKNSMIYPAFVLVAFMGVLVVMLVVVIPKLVSIFEETGQAVPFYTQVVITLSLLLRQWGLALVVLLVGGLIAVWRWGMTQPGKLFFHKLQISLPIIGELYRKLYMARFADNLQTLIVSGIPILRALSITGDVIGNLVYKKAMVEAIESVKAGSTISTAFEKTSEIPVLVTQMIRIGETSGRLEFILSSISKFYQREVDSTLENLVALIEPALIIFLGVGIGILVASVLVPLYNLVGTI